MTNLQPQEGQATGGSPYTSVLRPKVNLPKDELGQGKIVSTEMNKSTGHINTPGTYKDYL